LEPIEPFKWGRVATSGVTVARLNYYPSETIGTGLGWVDVYPGTAEDADPRWGLERAHGRAKLLTRFYVDPEGGGDREYYGAIDLDQSCHTFPVQAQTTQTSTTATSITCCTGHGSAPNLRDAVSARRGGRYVGPAIGRHDLSSGGVGTCGFVRWTGDYNLASEANQFNLVTWPDKFDVEIQAAFDGYPSLSSDWVAVKLYDEYAAGGSGGVGSQFYVTVGLYDAIRTTSADTQWSTVHGAVGAIGLLCTSGLATNRFALPRWLDPAIFLDEPYGTIRMIASGTVTGTGPYPGWKWCDGTNTSPDLRDKFVVGQGPNHTVGFTGGQSKHGGGTNDHAAHALTTGPVASGAGGTGASAITTNHGAGSTETDNEPPWYAVAFAKRTA
jgi:hypothetical protein